MMTYTVIVAQMAEDGNLYDTVIARNVSEEDARKAATEAAKTLHEEDDECVTILDENGREV